MSKKLIFRWSYRHHITNQIVRAKKRPFPMLIDEMTGDIELYSSEMKTTSEKTL